MKKSFYVAAMAGLIFSACSNETYLGGDVPQVKNDGAIGFGTKTGAVTRANVGLESSVKNFRVYGVKHYESQADSSLVFDNYLVRYTEGTAKKTATNSSNWEYVGIYDFTTPDSILLSSQTIRYWDYSAESYTFWALADGADKAQFGTSVTLEKGAPRKLNITGVEASDNDANNVLFTYGQTVKRSDYNKPVVLKFRRLASKVRLGFYETIPGYSVSDVKFYQGASTSPAVPVVLNGKFITKADYELIYNNAKGTVTSTASNQTTGKFLNFATTGLNLSKTAPTISVTGNYILSATPTPILTSAAEPTYADHAGKGTTYSSNQYMCVLPNENQADSAYIKVDFILTSTDGKEQIKVTGATATIPADYMKWKPNYAYTYLFKISDQVNGTTGHGQTAAEKMADLKADFPNDPFGHASDNANYGKDNNDKLPSDTESEYGKLDGKTPGKEGYGKNADGDIIIYRDNTGKIVFTKDAETTKPLTEKELNKFIEDVIKFKEDWIDAQKGDEHALYAITFDAVIEDVMDGQQGTVTTVSQPSITTYQDGSLVGDGIAYKAGDIEVKTNVTATITVKKVTITNGVITEGDTVTVTDNKFTAIANTKYQITATTTAGVTVTKLIEIPNN